MDGAVQRYQVWKLLPPEGVTTDVRTAGEWGCCAFASDVPRVPVPYPDPSALCSPYDYLFKWSTPPLMVTGLVKFFNERLNATNHENRKTSIGEVVRFLSYMLALALVPHVPLDSCWQEKVTDAMIFHPPNMGRHGMAKNRFGLLFSLTRRMHSVSESELDPEDIWRYCKWVTTTFNEHRVVCYRPSDKLVSDEGMCAYMGHVGSGRDDLPRQLFWARISTLTRSS